MLSLLRFGIVVDREDEFLDASVGESDFAASNGESAGFCWRTGEADDME